MQELDQVERSAAMVLAWRAAETMLFFDQAARAAVTSLPARPWSPRDALFADLVVVRTWMIDRLVSRRLEHGIRQCVVLGAGLDTRFHRIECPAALRVWELDRPRINRLAIELLGNAGWRTRLDTSLEHDWVPALRTTGHDPAQPTLWILEGVMEYLPSSLWARVANSIRASSAPGSAALVTLLDPRFPARVSDDPTFPFSRLPGPERVIDGLPGWSAVVHPPEAVPGRCRLDDTFAIIELATA